MCNDPLTGQSNGFHTLQAWRAMENASLLPVRVETMLKNALVWSGLHVGQVVPFPALDLVVVPAGWVDVAIALALGRAVAAVALPVCRAVE